MNFKIYWIKFKTFLEVQASKFVYNFNKFIPDVKTKYNLKYVEGGNKFNKLDVFYSTNFKKKKLPIVVYYHGGGWAAYSKDCYKTVCKRIASMGYVVFSCNYSLTPKYKMPKIMKDAEDSIVFAIKNAKKFGGDGSKVCLAGDSAGAQIASFVSGTITAGKGAEFFSEENCKLFAESLKANLLFYGAFDLNSIVYTEFTDIISYMNAIVNLSSDGAPELLQKYSPISYVSPKFLPSLIASGEIDKLHESQSKVFAELLEENKVKCEKVFFEQTEFRAMHAYLVVDGLKTTETTFSAVEAFLSEVFGD